MSKLPISNIDNISRNLLNKGHTYFLFLALLYSCAPVKEYYKFKFKSYSVDIIHQNPEGKDSVTVLKAVSPVDEDRLLSYDKRVLEEFAFENDLKVTYQPSEITIEKIVPASDSLRKEQILAEIEAQVPKIKKLKYYGIATVKDTALVNDDIAFERNLKTKKTVGVAGVLLIIFFSGLLFIYLIISYAIDSAISSCYIATACYGSYDAPEVRILRKFRDSVLKKHALGRVFIRVYYVISPAIARRLAKMHTINNIVRRLILDPIVRLAQKNLK